METAAEIQRLSELIKSGTRVISVSGLTSISAKTYILSQLQISTKRTLVIVTDSNREIETFLSDLEFFNPKDKRIQILPSFENDVYSGMSPHAETLEQRALTLWNLANGKTDYLLASAKSLITRILSPQEIKQLGVVIKRDEDFPPEELVETLISCGYVREEPLKNVGEFSVRGGIIDVWSPDAENPVRIEFFGDTVDSIREFDAETQLSIGQLKEISVAPMREFAATPKDLKDWTFFASERFEGEQFTRNLKDRTQFAELGETFPGWENLFPLANPRKSNIFEFLKDAVFVIDEPAQIEQTLGDFYDHLEKRYAQVVEADDIGLPPEELYLSIEEIQARLQNAQKLELRALGRVAGATDEEFALPSESESPLAKSRRNLFLFPTAEKAAEIGIQSRSVRKYHGDVASFVQSRDSGMLDQKFAFQTHGIADRFSEILRDYDAQIPAQQYSYGNLSVGFEIPSLNLSYLTEADIFGEVQGSDFRVQPQKTKAKSNRVKTDAFISDFRDLKAGDYVVHVDHGIGRFEGLQTIDTQGVEQEFMLLIYSENTKLFVPVERLDLVSRYSSGESTNPSLDRLGGLGWQKTKAKAKRAMRDMADELLRLYAERKLVQGFAFSADSPWQTEFEDSFPYQLTADQASAIEDTKADMERSLPMDRLIVGDVGYGKTEVAMRAAFKAAMDGKQVAVLTPTTVLAYQHAESFKKRFSAFPVKIELLSRFRSPKEQKEVVKAVEEGKVDILIGTHRILSADIKLPKLGLVVVDEEQRFGVAHKEKLKHLKKKVDVLTLSATPIPRTLNMSLLGMRDMSVIETPPRDRLAINTQVVQFSETVVKSAIELELARDGQVFFIHNRVETINSIAAHIKQIVPNARVVVAHGQMNEKEMETAVLDFVDRKYDVLVATTIIENGIDIARANTIIINRADNYGLSQLYQLRGRVGRSSRRAYAYLLIPSERELSEVARRRLSAIREFSDLGAGFRIAALDLEIRGSGNILGGQQSGHLDALGFDLYVKMLERTIQEMRGEVIEDEISVSINLGVDVAIPKDYIYETNQRLRTYKRISSAKDEETLRKLYEEISDRYGKLPRSVEHLFEYAKLRRLAEEMRVLSIDKTSGGFAVKLNQDAKVSPENLMNFVGESGSAFTPNGILRVTAADNLLERVKAVLEIIKK